jgi:hypothetical protein
MHHLLGLVVSITGRGSLVRVSDAHRLTRVPSGLAMFDLRAETMFCLIPFATHRQKPPRRRAGRAVRYGGGTCECGGGAAEAR